MSVQVVGVYSLAEVCPGLAQAIALMNPLVAQLDFALMGSFGLGALQSDISAQLNAALQMQVAIGISIANPLAALEAALQAAIQVAAQVTATLALGIPAVSLQVGVQLSASLAISALLVAKLGGIQALISAALAVKLPAISFISGLDLLADPIVILSIGVAGTDTLSLAGSEVNSLMAGGLPGINPGDPVYGVVLLTRAPSAWRAMQAIFKTQ